MGLIPSIDSITSILPSSTLWARPTGFQVVVNNFNDGTPLINGMYIINYIIQVLMRYIQPVHGG